MCVQRNIHEHVAAKKQCFTYSYVCACARVVLLIQHATHRHIVIYGFYDSTKIFGHYPTNGTIFGRKKKLLNMECVL